MWQYRAMCCNIYTKKESRLGLSCDPRGAVKLRRCMVSISELSAHKLGDSLIYHADSSMFCTGLQIP